MRFRRRSPRSYIQNSSWWTIISVIVLIIVYIIGWVANIVKLVGMDPVLTGEGVVRIIGIFVPFIGPIMGYFV